MHRKFARSFESLAGILEFTDEFFGGKSLDPGIRYAVDLVIDELFTNMVKYNAKSPADIALEFEHTESMVAVTLIDYESEHFDITQARPVDVTLPAKERPIGGLGIHLVHQIVDSLRYEFDAGVSKIVFTKNTEPDNV